MTASPTSLAELQKRFGPRYRWLVLGTVLIGTIASIISATIINVAVPAMSAHFAIGQERAQWLSAGFMAAMTLSMLTTPWLLSRFGYRRVYTATVVLLMAGAIVAGVAGRFDLVLAMRVIEGLASGVLQPIPAIIILRAFAPGEQGRAMGLFGFGVVLAPAIGPTVGGVLVEWWGWRAIFFAIVPFCAIAVAMARRYLPTTGPGGVVAGQDRRPLDLPGLVLAGVAIVALLNGLVRLHDPEPRSGLLLIALALGFALVFLWRQRAAASPLIDLSLFAHRPFAMGALVSFTYGMGLYGSTYLVPVFMQSALLYPPSQAGAVLLPAGLVLAATIPIAGRLADRRPPHQLVTAGLVLIAVSFVPMVWVSPQTSIWLVVLWTVIGRIGLGCVLPALNLGAMRGVQAGSIAQGASMINVFRQLGGAIGVSAVGIFLEWRLQARGAGGVLSAYGETFWLIAGSSALAVFAAARMTTGEERGNRPPGIAGG